MSNLDVVREFACGVLRITTKKLESSQCFGKYSNFILYHSFLLQGELKDVSVWTFTYNWKHVFFHLFLYLLFVPLTVRVVTYFSIYSFKYVTYLCISFLELCVVIYLFIFIPLTMCYYACIHSYMRVIVYLYLFLPLTIFCYLFIYFCFFLELCVFKYLFILFL